jgi:protein-disulfide isomerase
MKERIKIIFIIQLQVLFVIAIILFSKTNKISRMVDDTNKFVYRLLEDKELKALNEHRENDIVIGDKNAPVTLFMYSRIDCDACVDFFSDNYYKLKENYIDKGKLNLVIRYLVSPNKPEVFHATKCLNLAYQYGGFEGYSDFLHRQLPLLDSADLNLGLIEMGIDAHVIMEYTGNKEISSELYNLSNKARSIAIRSTPMFFINKRFLLGNSPFEIIKQFIDLELENTACEF